MRRPSNKILFIGYLLIVGAVMFTLNCLTPLHWDDWHYSFFFGTLEPIKSLGDIFKSQMAHYQVFNGRFPVHSTVQLFAGILGKGIFNVSNAAVFALFLYLIAIYTDPDKNKYYKIISAAFMLVFLVITGFKYGFLWLSGSVNYLWVATALLLFHLLMKRQRIANWALLPVFLFSFLSGWSHEGFVVGLGAAYFLYYVRHLKQLTRHRVVMLTGFYLGALFLVFAPASIYRAAHTGVSHLSLVDRIVNLHNLRLFFILIIIVIVRLFIDRKKLASWFKKEQILITATLVAILFVIFTGIFNQHSRLCIEIFSLVLIMTSIDWSRVNSRVVTCANVALLIFAGYAISCCARCYDVNCQELESVARGDRLIATTHPIAPSSFMRRYILDYAGTQVKDGINDDKYFGDDDWIPSYYGHKGKIVTFFPKSFLDNIKTHPENYNQFYTQDCWPFYAMRLAPDQSVWYAQLIYKPLTTDTLPWPLNRLCAKLNGDINNVMAMVRISIIDGERYAVAYRTRPEQDDRLEEIKLVDYPEWAKPALTSEPEIVRSEFFQ